MKLLHRKSSFRNYGFTLLIAVECLMSFTFLGYIHVPPISITIAYLPILLAGCFLSIPETTIIGVIFGLASMFKASSYYVSGMDSAFSPFSSDFPFGSLLLSVGARALFAFLIGFFLIRARKSRHPAFWIGVVAGISTKLQAFLVFAFMGVLFPQFGYDFRSALTFNIRDLLLALFFVVIMELAWLISRQKKVQNFCSYITKSQNRSLSGNTKPMYVPLTILLLGSLCAAVASAFYFVHRTTYMLDIYGISLSDAINHDLFHLQIQFLIATFSISLIMVIILLLIYKYFAYCEYLGGLDDLTGIMGRRMFLQYCDRLQGRHSALSGKKGWFLFADIDNFKTINDTLGHPAGDTALQTVSECLDEVFADYGKVGRMGGDEFAVIIEQELSPVAMKELLDHLIEILNANAETPGKLSCSIGACRFTYPEDVQTLYEETDQLLYNAKEKGRNCYVMASYENETMTQL